MGLFLWDSEPSKIFVGDTPISKVFLWDTQVRPSFKWNWDLTKAVLDGTKTTALSWFIIYWISFSESWDKLYYFTNNWNNTTWTLHQFTLTTPRDVTTRTNEVTMAIWGNYPYWVYSQWFLFRDNWKYLYIHYCWTSPTYIEMCELGTNYDISTAVLETSISINADVACPFYISKDWTNFRYLYSWNLYHATLATPYYITAWTSQWSKSLRNFRYVSPDEKYLYADNESGSIFKYSLWSWLDFINATQEQTLTKPVWSYWAWVYLNNDWTKLYTVRWPLNAQNIYTYNIS